MSFNKKKLHQLTSQVGYEMSFAAALTDVGLELVEMAIEALYVYKHIQVEVGFGIDLVYQVKERIL